MFAADEAAKKPTLANLNLRGLSYLRFIPEQRRRECVENACAMRRKLLNSWCAHYTDALKSRQANGGAVSRKETCGSWNITSEKLFQFVRGNLPVIMAKLHR